MLRRLSMRSASSLLRRLCVRVGYRLHVARRARTDNARDRAVGDGDPRGRSAVRAARRPACTNADNAGENPHPSGALVNTLNFEDCDANLVYQFDIGISYPSSSYNLEAWVGTQDCSQLTNRQTSATSVCWPVAPFTVALVNPFILNDPDAGHRLRRLHHDAPGVVRPDDHLAGQRRVSGPDADRRDHAHALHLLRRRRLEPGGHGAAVPDHGRHARGRRAGERLGRHRRHGPHRLHPADDGHGHATVERLLRSPAGPRERGGDRSDRRAIEQRPVRGAGPDERGRERDALERRDRGRRDRRRRRGRRTRDRIHRTTMRVGTRAAFP